MKVKDKKLYLIGTIILVIIIALILVLVFKKEENWVQEGNTITKGNQTLKIGDYYNYDETNNGKEKELIDVKWRVLGVEDGNLLIMSTSSVGEVILGEKDDLELSQKDYVDGVNKLNELASNYAKGKNAISARSINMDDINKITNYDYTKFFSGDIGEYGNEVTYYWNGEPNPYFEGKNGKVGNLSNTHNMFVWYDGNWHTEQRKEATKENPIKITTLKSNFYAYDNSNIDGEVILAKDTNEYKMLFTDELNEKNTYWVATPFISTVKQFAGYGYPIVKGDTVNYTYLVYSMGVSRTNSANLRVVVSID